MTASHDILLQARKLARAPRTKAAADATFGLLREFPVPPEVLEAVRCQLGASAITVPGLPAGLRNTEAFLEAVGREALALAADVVLTEPTIADCREAIEARITAKRWALGLKPLARAIEPSPERELRNSIRPWRKRKAEYGVMTTKVAVAMSRLFLGELLPARIAETVPANVLLKFTVAVLRGEDWNDVGERLTEAVLGGVGSSPGPTLLSADEVGTDTLQQPARQSRAA